MMLLTPLTWAHVAAEKATVKQTAVGTGASRRSAGPSITSPAESLLVPDYFVLLAGLKDFKKAIYIHKQLRSMHG